MLRVYKGMKMVLKIAPYNHVGGGGQGRKRDLAMIHTNFTQYHSILNFNNACKPLCRNSLPIMPYCLNRFKKALTKLCLLLINFKFYSLTSTTSTSCDAFTL